MIEGTLTKEEFEKKIQLYRRQNNKQILAAKERRGQVLKNLQQVIECENARLNLNYYERKALEENIDPDQKRRAQRIIDDLKLDCLEEKLTDNVIDALDEEMIDEQQQDVAVNNGNQNV